MCVLQNDSVRIERIACVLPYTQNEKYCTVIIIIRFIPFCPIFFHEHQVIIHDLPLPISSSYLLQYLYIPFSFVSISFCFLITDIHVHFMSSNPLYLFPSSCSYLSVVYKFIGNICHSISPFLFFWYSLFTKIHLGFLWDKKNAMICYLLSVASVSPYVTYSSPSSCVFCLHLLGSVCIWMCISMF